MRGTSKTISLPRRLICDLMRASMDVPFVSLSRSLNIRPLLEARAGAMAPAGWAAIRCGITHSSPSSTRAIATDATLCGNS